MNLKSTRDALGLSLQDVANLFPDDDRPSRQGILNAEAGKAPKLAERLDALYAKHFHKKIDRTREFKITFTCARNSRGQHVLRHVSTLPFDMSERFVDALLDGFVNGRDNSTTREF